MTEDDFLSTTRASYDTVAGDYAERFRDELAARPLDRAMLAGFAELVRAAGAGPVTDVGCGTGRVTAHLKGLGLSVHGIDLSPQMIAVARQAHPALRFDVGSMLALDLPDGVLGGVLAWYSTIHIPHERLPEVFAEFGRVLAPGGYLQLAFQAGEGTLHLALAEALGQAISLDFHRRQPDQVAGLLGQAGLVVRARLLREPDDSGDFPERTQQAFVLARKPGDCPSFLTVIPGAKPRAHRATAPALASDAIADPPFRFDVAGAPHTTRITGVGGTGVVTLSQILSAAGRIAGRQVRSLDQTGLAQKGGAVISDVKISADDIEQSHKAVAGECDLYLGCDLLVAADARNLAVADPKTTIAVVSTTKVPTGKMVVDKTVPFPDVDATADRIRSATRGEESVFVDARGLSITLLGTDQFANMLLAGVAFQTGALPLPAWAIEQAIELNGVQVEPNLQAFRRGRQRVAEPDAFAQAVAALSAVAPVRVPAEPGRRLIESVGAASGSELHRIVETRIPDLIDYQNAGYARRYADLVARVRVAEDRTVPGESKLSEAVAEFSYKLMAYKDEYEVARLLVDPQAEAAVRAEFGEGARVSYQLHPPVLRALGMERKLKLGPWARPGFRLLRAGKIARGAKLDPFGYTRVRRVERELIEEYTVTIDDVLRQLSTETYPRAVEIARLPDLVRGYENIKLANVALYRARVKELMSELATASR